MRAAINVNSVRRQHGMSLLFALLILLVMSVSVVAAIQVSGLQERSAGNYRNRTIAFNSAESALRDAEAYLSSDTIILPLFDGSTAGHYARNGLPVTGLTRLPTLAVSDGSSVDLWKDPAAIAFMRTSGIAYGSLTSVPGLSDVPSQPRYVIEMVNGSDRARMRTYRITAMAEGRDSALVVLQSYYTPPQFTVTP